MITRASRFYFGLGFVGLVLAVVYGMISNAAAGGGIVAVLSGDGAIDTLLGSVTFGYKGGVGDHIGYSVLMAFAVTNLAMGGLTSAFRDGDAEAVAQVMGTDAIPTVSQPTALSPWPVVMGFGVGVAAIGLATGPVMFTIGVIVMVLSGIEWMVQDWSERATGDPEVNRAIRNRIMNPIELPVAGLILIAIVVFCFSRLFLATSKDGAILAAAVLGIVIFALAVVMGYSPGLKRPIVIGVLVVGALMVLALGIVGAARGEREFEVHHEEAATAVAPHYALSGVDR